MGEGTMKDMQSQIDERSEKFHEESRCVDDAEAQMRELRITVSEQEDKTFEQTMELFKEETTIFTESSKKTIEMRNERAAELEDVSEFERQMSQSVFDVSPRLEENEVGREEEELK